MISNFENLIVVNPGGCVDAGMECWNIYQTILYCRDRKHGLGLRDESYKMLFECCKKYPHLAWGIFQNFVYDGVGSWADVKYFCDFLVHRQPCDSLEEDSSAADDPLLVEHMVNTLIDLMNYQIDLDMYRWRAAIDDYLQQRSLTMKREILGELPLRPIATNVISMAAKWVPRESSKYGWLFDKMVLRWARSHYPHYFDTLEVRGGSGGSGGTMDWKRQQKMICKISRMYRKMVAELSRELSYGLG